MIALLSSTGRIGPRRGFTLIEVLLAVLILALALLGLGAVIPVVVREQRSASDATMGATALAAARAYVAGRPDLDGQNNQNTAWDAWLNNQSWSQTFLWELPNNAMLSPQSGLLTIGAGGAAPAFISVADRLWPARGASATAPQLVWDMVARRVTPFSPGALDPQKIQVAIFVRRIDPAIRVPQNNTLYALLTTGDPPAKLALGIDPKTGLPTRNGTGEYSGPVSLNALYFSQFPDRLTLQPGMAIPGQNMLMLASQAGQRLVDQFGNVYTVRGQVKGSPGTVLVDPSVPSWVEPGTLQVVFTPQTPVGVTVFTIVRPVDEP